MDTRSSVYPGPHDTPPPAPSTPSRDWRCTALFLALLAFHVIVNLWWLAQDNHPIRTDEESHMLAARQYYDVLFLTHHDSMFQKLIAVSNIPPSQPAHPPLLHILGALAMALLGYGPDVMTGVNTIAFLFTLFGCLLLFRRFLDPWESLYAVFVVSFTPIVCCSSRYFMTDVLSLTFVVWALYALLRSDYLLRTGWSFAFALLNGFAILARTTSPVYYLVPCLFAAALGLLSSLPLPNNRNTFQRPLRAYLLNSVIVLAVSIGVCAPWYFKHLDEFYDYWVYKHRGGPGGPIALFQPDTRGMDRASALDPLPAAPKPAPSSVAPGKGDAAAKTPLSGKKLSLGDQVAAPRIPWDRYPLYIRQNAVFYPMYLLGVAGIIAMLFLKRFRNSASFMIFLWVIGSWVLMTVLMKYATPRYALQAMPGFALFAALAVMAPPWRRVRQAGMIAFAALLIFQFGNLSIHAYGPIAQCGFYTRPLPSDPKLWRPYDITLYKDQLALGFSYTRLGAPVTENFKDRIFGAMVRTEASRQSLRGEYANYLRLGMRGMEFDEKHYWPDEAGKANPYRLSRLPANALPKRKLHDIGLGRVPEDLLPNLNDAEYIVYDVDSAAPQTEEQYVEFFKARGFESIERFQEARVGEVDPQTYGVLARVHAAAPIEIASNGDIDKLNLFQLYQFKRTHGLDQNPALKAYADKRFETLALGDDPKPYKLNDYLTYIRATASPEPDGWVNFLFIFHVDKAIDTDLRMYFHGRVAEADRKQLPPQYQKDGLMLWNFNPDPPTRDWPANDYVVIMRRIQPAKIKYTLKVGLYSDTVGYFGSGVPLGEMDFAAILRAKQ